MNKHLFKILFTFLAFISVSCFSNNLELEQYTLNNGLTIILNEDHTKPEVFGYMVCKAGGKDDPSDATGMAHYMEHMLFKGTTKLGTTNWKKEKVHIDSIFLLYDLLGKTTDDVQRKEIQLKINDQSVKANEYAIPNEFSNAVKKMGGTGLNANTSPDRTVFFNTFPPYQIEPWLNLYAHRIQDAVFRGFQSELEVVYEEKNMYTDMFFWNILESFQKNFFKVHPYGQQSIIGTIDDLKNPSLTKMYDFYKTWYVPNNMALVLCGDFNSEQVKPMIEKAFGAWERKEIPEKHTWEESPLNGRELVEVNMSPVKIGVLGYATVPEGHPDEIAIKICDNLLSSQNGSGYLDQLALNNELLQAQVFEYPYYDYGVSIVFFVPKIVGQKLEEAEQLIIKEINRIKEGDFEDWRIEAVKKELYRQYQENLESNRYRGITIGEVFARGQDISKIETYTDRVNKITKEDIIAVANKYYGENYLAFFSNMGSFKGEKIEKPGYKPVISNTNEKSEFIRQLEQIKPLEYTPEYIDFEKSIAKEDIAKGVTLYVTENPKNDIFSLKIKFKAGDYDIDLMQYAGQILDYAYCEEFGKAELKNEMAKIGATYSIYSDKSYTVIDLRGIEEDLNRALYLINGLIQHPIIDQDEINTLLEGEKANRKIEKSEADMVADAAIEYIKYGKESEYVDRLTLKEIKALQSDQLVEAFKQATNYQVEIHYVGKKPIEEVAKSITENIQFNADLKPNEVPIYMPVQEYKENSVYFINKKDAIQSKVYFLKNGSNFEIASQPDAEAFNQYFGGGFSGLVLQEIREYRSLAYSAGARYVTPNCINKPAYFIGYVGAQADKTNESLEVFVGLTKNMPVKADRIEYIRPYLEQSAISNHPDFRGLSTWIVQNQQKGISKDPALLFKEDYQKLEFEDIQRFYEANIKNKPLVITIVGDKKSIGSIDLSKYGKVNNIRTKDLYRD